MSILFRLVMTIENNILLYLESYGEHSGKEQLLMLGQRSAQERLDMRPMVLLASSTLSPMNW